MLSEETETGTAFLQSDADGVNGRGLRIQKKWRKLPKQFGNIHGPQYEVTAGRVVGPKIPYGDISQTVTLSDRQMQELFHAWLVLRKEYEDDNPSLVERDKKAQAHKERQEIERERLRFAAEGV